VYDLISFGLYLFRQINDKSDWILLVYSIFMGE